MKKIMNPIGWRTQLSGPTKVGHGLIIVIFCVSTLRGMKYKR